MDAIISHGCFLRECTVQHSIVGVRSRLDYGVELIVSHWIRKKKLLYYISKHNFGSVLESDKCCEHQFVSS